MHTPGHDPSTQGVANSDHHQSTPLNHNGYHRIAPNDVDPNSPYGQMVMPQFREQAATIIQRWFRSTTGKSYKGKPRTTLAQGSQARLDFLQEPKDDTMARAISVGINSGDYRTLNFSDPDFKRNLFKALRLNLIDQNQLLTTQLLYEAAIAFNHGKLPKNTSEIFKRHLLGNDGPYNYGEISYLTEDIKKEIQAGIANKQSNAYHYYTIDLSADQIDMIVCYTVHNNWLRDSRIKRLVTTYLKKLNIDISLYNQLETSFGRVGVLNRIQEIKPSVGSFISPLLYGLHTDGSRKLYSENDISSIRLLANIIHVETQIPSIVIAENDHSDPISVSMVIATMETYQFLQNCIFKDEVVHAQPIAGQFTTRLIRAMDELPEPKGSVTTDTNDILKDLYPEQSNYPTPSRPVEITHPDYTPTPLPHGYDPHNFLLTWHDVFHAWRSSENFKGIFRHLRQLHSTKGGLTLNGKPHLMTKEIWSLVDMDFSFGCSYRKLNPSPDVNEKASNIIVNSNTKSALIATKSFMNQDQDDINTLIIFDMIVHHSQWRPYLGSYSAYDLLADNMFDKKYQSTYTRIQEILKNHPGADIDEVIIRDLLQPLTGFKKLQIALVLQHIDLKKCIYWTKHNGLYFKKSAQYPLDKNLANQPLRKMNPADLLDALIGMTKLPAIDEHLKTIEGNIGDIKTQKDLNNILSYVAHSDVATKDHLLLAILQNPKVDIQHIQAMCGMPVSDTILTEIVKRKIINPEILVHIAQKAQSTTPLDALFDDVQFFYTNPLALSNAILENTHVTTDHLKSLCNSKLYIYYNRSYDSTVQKIVQHQKTTAEVLIHITQTKRTHSNKTLEMVVQHHETTAEVIRRMAETNSMNIIKILEMVAKCPETTEDFLVWIAQNTTFKPSYKTLLNILDNRNSNTEAVILAVLRNQNYPKTHKNLKKHTTTNQNLVKKMKDYYTSQCSSAVFNKSAIVFGANVNYSLSSVISSLISRSYDSYNGASAKTLVHFGIFFAHNLQPYIRSYYKSQCFFPWYNQSKSVIGSSDTDYEHGPRETIKNLENRKKANPQGASMKTYNHFAKTFESFQRHQ